MPDPAHATVGSGDAQPGAAFPSGGIPDTTRPPGVGLAEERSATWATDGVLRRAGLLACAAALLIVLVVFASRSSVLPAGSTAVSSGPVAVIVRVVQILVVALEILAFVLLFALRRRPRRKPPKDDKYVEPLQVHWAIKLLIVLFLLLMSAGLVYAVYTGWRRYTSSEVAPLFPEPSELFGRPDQIAPPGPGVSFGWIDLAAALGLVALVLIVVVRQTRRGRPARRPTTEPERRARLLVTAVDESLGDIRLETDPRRAVIAAYAAMECVLAAHGLPRRPVEAPLEYLARVFGEIGTGSDALRTLTDLFELARFSHHAISRAMKERAIDALIAVRDGVKVSP